MKLTIKKFGLLPDWYTIERAVHEGRKWFERTGLSTLSMQCSSRFSDADVEGTAAEMAALAKAIEERGVAEFGRCAVDATTEVVRFRSPRNSQVYGECSRAEADGLASEIRAKLGAARNKS